MRTAFVLALLACSAWPGVAADPLRPVDVFDLEHASDPHLSPSGKQVVFVRHSFDIFKDRGRTRLWQLTETGTDLRPATDGLGNEHSPSWSADGRRLLYISDAGGSPQLYCRWMDNGQTARLTNLASAPLAPAWSRDGTMIAFSAFVEEAEKPFIEMPAKPAGAEWAPAPKIITETTFRHDGRGYLKKGRRHLFVVPAEGGAARQLTSGPHDYCGARFSAAEAPAWSADGKSIIVSAFRGKDAGDDPYGSELYEVRVADGTVKPLTERAGPDTHPVVSPDGKRIAYLGFDDKKLAYQQTQLFIMNRDGTEKRLLSTSLDRDLANPQWSPDGSGVYVQYHENGDIKVAIVDLEGRAALVADHVGGTDIGRPYSSGGYAVNESGTVAFTLASSSRPAEVALRSRGDSTTRRLTRLNENLLGNRSIGEVEEVWFPSSFDGKKVQGWLVKPPGFDPAKKYPLILEIHGGPYADYGPSFAMELQLFAAAGYAVLYINPRGSTGYGEAFAQLINNDYPGHDYDDLMSGVDFVVKKGFIDERNLFVTGGSGGGVLTAWIVGKTNRFRAAVSCKPVINWTSFALTADLPGYFARYWLAAPPWENPAEANRRSPLSLVGNVKTPTMLLTGEDDHRTPISESEQFYTALKLRGVDTALVRFPGASHAIVDRPSRLIAKTACILKWFETYRVR